MTFVDNIDNRAELIYDYIYNHNEKKYKKESISLQNINTDTIKLNDSKYWINNILNNNITFIKNINNIFLFKRNNNLPLNILLYPLDDINLDNLHSQNNMNAVMSYILSELSINKKTRHLLLNLLNIDINSNDIKDFLIKYPEVDVPNLLKYKKIGLSVTEHFFKMKTLDEVLKENTFTDEKYKVLFFQILHTLSVIQKEYPEFRHNQLHPNKIYCYFKNKQNSYSSGNIIFNVPDIGFDIKLYHYDKSIIYSRWDNQDLTDNEKIVNKSYDWLTFINTLDIKNLPPLTKSFVNEMLKLNINKESVIPINLILSHNYFNSLKKNISNNNIMKHIDTTTMSSDSNNKLESSFFRGIREIKLNKLNILPNNIKKSSKKKSSKKKSSKKKSSKKKSRNYIDSLDAISLDSADIKEIYNNDKRHLNKIDTNTNQMHGMYGMGMNSGMGMPQMGMDSGMGMNSGMGMPQMGMDSGMGMSRMGMPQMGMPQMGMPQMGMPQMGMDSGMGMPQMGMPQMGMPQMGMPQMGMPQMGMDSGMGMPQMGMPQMGMNIPPMSIGAGMNMPQMGMDSGINMDSGMNMPQMGMDSGMNMPQMGMDSGMNMPQMGMDSGMNMPQIGMGMDAGMNMPQMGMDSGMNMPQIGMDADLEMNQSGGKKKKFFFLKKNIK
jgi:hypothetical protein